MLEDSMISEILLRFNSDIEKAGIKERLFLSIESNAGKDYDSTEEEVLMASFLGHSFPLPGQSDVETTLAEIADRFQDDVIRELGRGWPVLSEGVVADATLVKGTASWSAGDNDLVTPVPVSSLRT